MGQHMNCVRFVPHRTRVFCVTRLPCKTQSHTFPNNYRLRYCSITNGSGAPSHTYKCCRPFVICWVSSTVSARVTCAFRLGSHMFPERNTSRIVFCIGNGLHPVLMCDNAISQTVPENLCTRSSAANRLQSAVYHRRFHYY